MGVVRIRVDGERVLVVTSRAEVDASAQDVRAAAAFVLRAALCVRPPPDLRAGPLLLSARVEGTVARIDGDGSPSTLDVTTVADWSRSLGESPLGWTLTGRYVSLQACGVTVWTAGPQTAATFGLALALPLEHGGVFFGAGAPFEEAVSTALVPEGRAGGPAVRIAAYTQRRFGLRLEEVGRVALRGAEFTLLHRQLLGLLRAMTLEQPQAVIALRLLDALPT